MKKFIVLGLFAMGTVTFVSANAKDIAKSTTQFEEDGGCKKIIKTKDSEGNTVGVSIWPC